MSFGFKIFFFAGLLFSVQAVWGQGRFHVHYEDGRASGLAGRKLPTSLKLEQDTLLRTGQLSDFQRLLFSYGYLSAEVAFSGDSVRVRKGPAFKWGRVSFCDSTDEKIAQLAGGITLREGSILKPDVYSEIFERTIRYYEDHGYPFVSVRFNRGSLRESGVFDACIEIEMGPLVRVDSIEIKGKLRVSRNFFLTYTGLRPGKPYAESGILLAVRRSRALSWATESQPPRIIFLDESARLRFFLEPQRSNFFDGFLGFLPDDRTAKVNITGQMRIKLQNALSRGETIDVDWRRLQLNSRDLKARALLPCLFRTPFGPEYQIRLFQRDTIFVDVNQEIALSYSLSGNNAIRVFYKNRNSSLVSSKGYANITQLPDYADVYTGSYGLGIRLEESDDRFNPRKAFFIQLNAWAGNKEIRINPAINPEAYKGIKLKSTQITAEGNADWFIPLPGKFVLVNGFKGGFFVGERLLLNEAFRLGGLRSLRGFDEESIFASSYFTGNLEIRFLPDRSTNLFAFVNGGWYENKNVNRYVNDRPYGFGSGIQFLTRAGQFAFTYALGGQRGFQPSLRTAKVHFGITSTF